jgi:hypothetical protein
MKNTQYICKTLKNNRVLCHLLGGIHKYGRDALKWIKFPPKQSMKGIPIKKSGYVSTCDVSKKEDCNLTFAKYCLKFDPSHTGKGLILDAMGDKPLNTCFYLLENNIPLHQFDLPNPFEFQFLNQVYVDENDMTHLPLIYNKTLGELLRHTTTTYKKIWADYCSTYQGSSFITNTSSPKDDVEYLFQNQRLENHSIFAITCSVRRAGGGTNNEYRFITNHIQKVSSECGFVCVEEEKITYGAMIFLLFSVCKISYENLLDDLE